MTYLLDTNACIRYLSGRSIPLMQKLRTKPLNSIVICSSEFGRIATLRLEDWELG